SGSTVLADKAKNNVTTSNSPRLQESMFDNSRCAASVPSFSRIRMNVGINAVLNEPATTLMANRGSRNAIRNASRASEVPNVLATISSLTTLTSLAAMVSAPIVSAAPKMLRLTDAPIHRFHPSINRNQTETFAVWISGSGIGLRHPPKRDTNFTNRPRIGSSTRTHRPPASGLTLSVRGLGSGVWGLGSGVWGLAVGSSQQSGARSQRARSLLLTPGSWLLASGFWLLASGFRLPCSALRLPASEEVSSQKQGVRGLAPCF